MDILSTTTNEFVLGISSGIWQRYDGLRAKLEDETLTAVEQQELSTITDQIEEANARRIKTFIRVATLRHTTLDALIDEFDLRSPAYL